jgi:hyperosmotically inducible protein
MTIPNVKFNANNTYTVVITGKAKGMPKLEATIVEDKLVGAIKSGEMTRAEYEKNKESYAEEAKRLGRKIGAGANDGWLWTKTRASLAAEDDLRDSTINVDVDNDVVTLSGTVANATQKAKAEKIASSIEGVKSVKNQLTISAK